MAEDPEFMVRWLKAKWALAEEAAGRLDGERLAAAKRLAQLMSLESAHDAQRERARGVGGGGLGR